MKLIYFLGGNLDSCRLTSPQITEQEKTTEHQIPKTQSCNISVHFIKKQQTNNQPIHFKIILSSPSWS